MIGSTSNASEEPILMMSHVADGMIGTVNTKRKKKSSKNYSPIITLPDSPKGESSPEVSAEIHVVETSMTKSKSGSKNKGNNKNKRNSKEKTDKDESNDEKRKPRYPCFICEQDHFTKECPYRDEVTNLLKDRNNLLS